MMMDAETTTREWEAYKTTMERQGAWTLAKPFPTGMYAAIKPLIFHWTMIYGMIGDTFSYEDRWCYPDEQAATKALLEWDGNGDPTGWHRHPKTSRRRPDCDPGREYLED